MSVHLHRVCNPGGPTTFPSKQSIAFVAKMADTTAYLFPLLHVLFLRQKRRRKKGGNATGDTPNCDE